MFPKIKYQIMPPAGFSLIELIMVLTLMSVLSAIVTVAFVKPFEGHTLVSQQTKLLAATDAALSRMEHDISNAVPNSVRVRSVGSISVIELMYKESAGRYRYFCQPGVDEALIPTEQDDQFDVLGNIPSPSSFSRLIVNPVDVETLYFAANQPAAGFITPSNIAVGHSSLASSDHITLSQPFEFDPIDIGVLRKRFYISDAAVMYRCDPMEGTLFRYSGYHPNSVASTSVPSGSAQALLSDQIKRCHFDYYLDASQRNGFVTLDLTLGKENTVGFIKQVRVDNVP